MQLHSLGREIERLCRELERQCTRIKCTATFVAIAHAGLMPHVKHLCSTRNIVHCRMPSAHRTHLLSRLVLSIQSCVYLQAEHRNSNERMRINVDVGRLLFIRLERACVSVCTLYCVCGCIRGEPEEFK